ncbi:MAG: sigma-54 dependent transcriptional regulator [Pseudomonadota bacterium]
MTNQNALVVDDEPDIRELLTITLSRMGVDCSTAANLGAAKEVLNEQHFDLCLTDMRLPDGDGLELVAYIAERFPGLPVAVITAHGNMEAAIQALKAGAFDFVTKPVDLTVLRNLVSQAINLGTRAPGSGRELTGQSQATARLRETIAKVARSQAPVYISGESGTGKELVARLIHEQGARATQPFVPVNCGAIPNELIESELFGHKKGSFTGAVGDKDGLFQSAQGGTLFLDEIAELPVQLQVKLLRAIQEKRVRPIGAAEELAVDCRILSATHQNLAALVEEGLFRQDLFYRINVIELKVPALRDRHEDIEPLIDHFLTLKSEEFGISKPQLSGSALQALQAYPFPGNVRELENTLERALALCESDAIEVADLQLPVEDLQLDESAKTASQGGELRDLLDGVEKQRILEALEATRWNRTKAARNLGISLRALRYRMEKLGVGREQD